MGSKMTFAFVIPDAFWTTAGAFLSALTTLLVAYTIAKIKEVEKNTNSINSRLQDTIARQERERIQTAEVTALKADVVKAQHEPQQ